MIKQLLTRSIFGIFTGLQMSAALAQSAAPGTSATPAPPAGPGFMMQLPVILGFFALMYVLILRPQKQQQKKQIEFTSALKKGDEVVLASGFLGTIVGLTDRIATVEVSDGVEIRVLRSQIQGYSKDVLSPA
jgi:preprotein translocase subunit YajC